MMKYNPDPTSGSIARPREIGRAFDQLHTAQEELRVTIESLCERLAPLLSAPRPTEQSKTAQPGFDSGLAHQVATCAATADEMIALVQELLSRLEI